MLGQDLLDAGQPACPACSVASAGRSGQVVERDQSVGLAAAEVGLKLDHRVAPGPGEPASRPHNQVADALGDEGPAEELDGVAVLVGRLAPPHLVQVGGELGQLEAAGGDVLVGGDHLPPGGQAGFGTALDLGGRGLAVGAPGLLVVLLALQVLMELAHPVGLAARRHRLQQPLGGVEGPQGVVGGERFVVGPGVAHVLEFGDVVAVAARQLLAEDGAPLVPHHLQKELGVGRVDLAGGAPSAPSVHALDGDGPVAAELGPAFPVHEGGQPLGQEPDGLADPFIVGERHVLTYLPTLNKTCPPVPGFSTPRNPVRRLRELPPATGGTGGRVQAMPSPTR